MSGSAIPRQIFATNGQYENWVNKYLESSFALAYKVVNDSKKGWFSGNDNQNSPRNDYGVTHIHHHNYMPWVPSSSPTVINNYGNGSFGHQGHGTSRRDKKPQENNDVAGMVAFAAFMGLMYGVGKVYSDWKKISAESKKASKFSKEFNRAAKEFSSTTPGLKTINKVIKCKEYILNRLERDMHINISLLVAGISACLFISVGALMHIGSAVLIGKLLVIPTAGLACFKYGYETNDDVIKKANKIIKLLNPNGDQ